MTVPQELIQQFQATRFLSKQEGDWAMCAIAQYWGWHYVTTENVDEFWNDIRDRLDRTNPGWYLQGQEMAA